MVSLFTPFLLQLALAHCSTIRGRTGLKSNANKAPKQYGGSWKGMELNRGNVARKIHATIDVNEHNAAPLSKSLLGILPQHVNNTDSAIRTAIRDSASAVDGDILYSFDNKGPSPGSTGRNIDLGGLVDLAEKKWANDQIEKIVNGEYEVLDDQGEITVLKKGKRSPKQKAAKVTPAIPKTFGKAEDDGFELI